MRVGKRHKKRCSQYATSKALVHTCIITISQSPRSVRSASPPIGGSVQKRSLSVAPAADEFTRDGFTHRTSDERRFFVFFFRITTFSCLPTERKRKQTRFLPLRGNVPDFIGDGDCFHPRGVTPAFPPRSAPGAIVARDFRRA